MNKNEVTINGVTYEAVDIPMGKDNEYNCLCCDIYKIRPPQRMCISPICCDKEYRWVNLSCCIQENEDIHRIWKIK